jgi:hypothetical protein
VGFVETILHLPYAYVWLPGLVFFVIAGGGYWLTRTGKAADGASPDGAQAADKTVVKAKPSEQRGAHRRQGNPVQVHVGTPEDKKDTGLGCVLDRSMGGMRLALYHEVNVGAVLSVRPVHVDAMVPWIDLEVRSCRLSSEMHDQFEVGCQYVKSPPYSIQLLYG